MAKNKDLIFGKHPVLEAIKSGRKVEKVYLLQGTRGPLEKELRALSKAHGFPVTMIPKEKLQKMVPHNHQGVAAQLSLVDYKNIEDILPWVYEKGETPLFILLDGVTDVRNLGAIARSAHLCGAHAIIYGEKKSAMINAEAVKASAGALLKIPVCRVKSLTNTIQYLKDSGISILTTNIPSETPVHQIDFELPSAIVMGSEGEGVGAAILRLTDTQFWIPQKGDLNSFNVSVASGIVLYEAMRQRLLSGS